MRSALLLAVLLLAPVPAQAAAEDSPVVEAQAGREAVHRLVGSGSGDATGEDEDADQDAVRARERAERIAAATEALRARMPRELRERSFLGTEAWGWAALAVLIAAALVVATLLRVALSAAVMARARRAESPPAADAVRHAVRPFALAGAGLLVLRALPYTGIDGLLLATFESAARLFAVGMVAWSGLRVADLVAGALARRAALTESRLDDLYVPLARTSLKLVVVALGLVYGFQALGVAVAPLVASLGLGGLAFAFAARDTIENFFGSIAVMVDRPFEVGDTVTISGTTGEVVEVGFRSTRLRTGRGSIVTLPNALLVRAAVERLGRGPSQAVSFTLRLDPATPPDALLALRGALRDALRARAHVDADRGHVRVTAIGESSIDLNVQAYVAAPDAAAEAAAREGVLTDAIAQVHAHGVRLASSRVVVEVPPAGAAGSGA